MRRILKLVPLVLLLLVSNAPAQDFRIPKAPSVQVAPVSPVTVAPGKSARVRFHFRVEPGFHINSNQPHDDLLTPTALKFDVPTDIVVGKVKYPPGRDESFAFLPGQKLSVYQGDFAVTALLTTARTVAPGTYRVRGGLKYQACDNRQCYPPKQVPVEFDVKVQRPKRVVRRGNPGQSPHVR
ncbi:MAG: protein-disulfide reductase DsbD domain-containing protein [Terriglobales bacterium]